VTNQPAPVPPPPGSSSGALGSGDRAAAPARQLEEYFAANRGRYTDEALSAAARAAGYADADIAAGLTRARARDVTRPVQARARTLIRGAYVVVFVVLVAAMAVNSGVAFAIGTVVLLITMLFGLALSQYLIRNAAADAALAMVLALPVVFLIVIAGACIATGLPFTPRGI
jgi:hypothetical protein